MLVGFFYTQTLTAQINGFRYNFLRRSSLFYSAFLYCWQYQPEYIIGTLFVAYPSVDVLHQI